MRRLVHADGEQKHHDLDHQIEDLVGAHAAKVDGTTANDVNHRDTEARRLELIFLRVSVTLWWIFLEPCPEYVIASKLSLLLHHGHLCRWPATAVSMRSGIWKRESRPISGCFGLM